MGSLFKPNIPAPPPPAPPVTMRDEIGGVEQVPVTNPDGTTTYVTRRLALTAEEQAKQDELNRIMSESMAEISKLSASDYAEDESTKKVLDQWQQVQTEKLGKNVTERAQAEEADLARRGLADSSTAQSIRRQRKLDEQQAREALGRQRDELGSQVRAEKLGLQQNLYSIAASQQDVKLAREQQSATRGQSALAAVNAERQASLLDYYQTQVAAANTQTPLSMFSRAFGGGLGGAVTNSFSGGTGGLVGSWLWRR